MDKRGLIAIIDVCVCAIDEGVHPAVIITPEKIERSLLINPNAERKVDKRHLQQTAPFKTRARFTLHRLAGTTETEGVLLQE